MTNAVIKTQSTVGTQQQELLSMPTKVREGKPQSSDDSGDRSWSIRNFLGIKEGERPCRSMEHHSESHSCVGENKYHAENIFSPSSDPQMKGLGSKKNLCNQWSSLNYS